MRDYVGTWVHPAHAANEFSHKPVPLKGSHRPIVIMTSAILRCPTKRSLGFASEWTPLRRLRDPCGLPRAAGLAAADVRRALSPACVFQGKRAARRGGGWGGGRDDCNRLKSQRGPRRIPLGTATSTARRSRSRSSTYLDAAVAAASLSGWAFAAITDRPVHFARSSC